MTTDYAPGWQRTCRIATNLSRADIALYAGASGDVNRIHVDEPYATGPAGQPSVLAHGMLTMALTGAFVSSVFGHGQVRRFGGRFTGPVFPGDSLDCTMAVRSTSGDASVLELRTCNHRGVLVFVGHAVVTTGGQVDTDM